MEALPYIKSFYGKTVVVKYGGSAMSGSLQGDSLLQDIVLMRFVGMKPVVVHGGGPEITATMKRLGKQAQFVDGLRVTDQETVEVAEMVLAGKINRAIVAAINAMGGRAVGLSGKDGNLLRARRRLHQGPAGPVDLGFVGDVEEVNPEVIHTLSEAGYIPVISPIGFDAAGATYNINADSVAGELAAALGAHKLVLLTDVEGIYRDPRDRRSLISALPLGEVQSLIHSGALEGGMIPKVMACVRALESGVAQSHILDGRQPHALLLEIFTQQGIGTMVVPNSAGGVGA